MYLWKGVKSMKAIFNQTINRMFRLKNVLIYFGIVVIPTILIALGIRFGSDELSLSEIQSMVNGIYMLVVFLWLTGIPFIVNIVAHGTGLFASEEAEGTMSILVAKPVNRYEIVLGKVLGLAVASFVYQIISLIFSQFIFYFLSGVDVDTVSVFASSIPSVLLYSLFVTIFFTALSSAMSVIFKKKIAGIIIALLFLFVTFGVFPIVRSLMQFSNAYTKYHVYLFDFNYHFGLIFQSIQSLFSSDLLSSSANVIVGTLTGTYTQSTYDMDIVAYSGYGFGASPVSYINPTVLTLIYLLVAALLFVFVFWRMNKKDVN